MLNNKWTELSIELANQRDYLDQLFRVYPTNPEGLRDIDKGKWSSVEEYFNHKDNDKLIRELLGLDLFPIKDSYVAYLKRDKTSINRNPQTINRLCGRLYEMGLDDIYQRCSEPKETNRQIGPLFRRWLHQGCLGITPVSLEVFESNLENAILDGSDSQLLDFAKENLDYNGDKGLDLIARFNGKYVIGEAKFLTDFGGHQNAQFEDAIRVLHTKAKAIKIAILDGVIYINSNNKMHKKLLGDLAKYNIMSALVLRTFLYQL